MKATTTTKNVMKWHIYIKEYEEHGTITTIISKYCDNEQKRMKKKRKCERIYEYITENFIQLYLL